MQITGNITLMPPHLVFRKRPDNLITVQLRFVAELRLEGLTSTPRDVLIELRTSVDAGAAAPVSNGVITPRADLSNAQVTALEIGLQEGYLGKGYTAALRSPVVLNALSQVVRAIPPTWSSSRRVALLRSSHWLRHRCPVRRLSSSPRRCSG